MKLRERISRRVFKYLVDEQFVPYLIRKGVLGDASDLVPLISMPFCVQMFSMRAVARKLDLDTWSGFDSEIGREV